MKGRTMNRTAGSLLAAVLAASLTAAVAAAAATGLAAPAHAQDAAGTVGSPPVVVAAAAGTPEDDARVVARAPQPTATAGIPRGIVVTEHRGKAVSVSTAGQKPQVKPRPGAAPAVFRDLAVGRTYTVAVGGAVIGRVLVVDAPGAADGLVVRATASPTAVDLTWTYTPSTNSGAVAFDITATASGSAPLRASVTDALAARLTGLDPHALYAFAVTPRNSAGSGTATTATMTRTLADVVGRDTDAPAAKQSSPTPLAAAAPAQAPPPNLEPPATVSPPRPAGPSTVTVWLCPDGSTDVDGVCTKFLPYTYHDETQTAPYTFHSQFVETSRSWRDFGTDWSGTTCPNGGTLHDGHCVGWDIQGYTQQVKDSPPAGWMDDGSTYVKVTRIKDAAPTGWLDDGTQWVMAVAKVWRTVSV